MRRLASMLLPLLTAGCGAAGDIGPAGDNQATELAVEPPSGGPPSGTSDVIGAAPGPCGSTRAESTLGKAFSPDLAAEIKRLSGAKEVNFVDFRDRSPLRGRDDPRRLNVLLSESDRVILLQCG